MNEKLISVIIPVYNVEKYLRECLESVVAQTYKNFEVILVNDGSTDSSFDICREYLSKDSRFKLVNKANGGLSSARNAGLKVAVGEYVLFLDSDDKLTKDALSEMICRLNKNDVDFVFFESIGFDDLTEKTKRERYSYRKQYQTDLACKIMKDMSAHKEFHPSACTYIVKREVLERFGISFYDGILYEDMLFTYELYSLCGRAAHIHKALHQRRYRESSIVTAKIGRKNFSGVYTVYKEITAFSDTLPQERVNRLHIIRCAFRALNIYRDLNKKEKQIFKNEYADLKKDILSHNAFGDKALKQRCRGYYSWAAYKVMQKLFIGDPYRFDSVLSNAENKVLMLLPHMVGGGAERVAAQIINQMNADGYSTRFILSSDKYENVVRSDLNEKTPLFLLPDEMPKEAIAAKAWNKFKALISSVLCKPFEAAKKPVPAAFAKLSVTSQYRREIKYMRKLMKLEPDLKIITFLQPTIPITLLAARGLPNKVIVSERSDPVRLMKKRYGYKFIKKYYQRADKVVFQTEFAKSKYPENISARGTVITNPLKQNLPNPYSGERNKYITTFCRISKVKNLPLLIDAFNLLHKDYPDYVLRIIGDAPNAEGEAVVARVKQMATEYGISDSVVLEPFRADVHEYIIKDAMYVNSSDYEGISNSMLEAMAIGMPVVCTNCDGGGAEAMIRDGKNGLLVPKNDKAALCAAMKRVIEDKALAEKMSLGAVKLRDELSLEKITKRWEELIG